MSILFRTQWNHTSVWKSNMKDIRIQARFFSHAVAHHLGIDTVVVDNKIDAHILVLAIHIRLLLSHDMHDCFMVAFHAFSFFFLISIMLLLEQSYGCEQEEQNIHNVS